MKKNANNANAVWMSVVVVVIMSVALNNKRQLRNGD
jgi:hypothetical protein